ncbi:V-type ATP synthase subunit I [Conexivisphaera calida]|uniref:A-type ATP synthase subunit I n=1 Tax=Conexivisphaera calida TaxID=1874277 RepID=A0A4P2VAT5_9ARCH|nr:V-type ATPase 116kDa subunit family protein [Conexivisphaera calida]BBE41596.1 V-type ATP synthase subunit I [Conexivisphaera calida]
MPVERSQRVVLATSREKLDKFISDLVSFEYFHFAEESQEFLDYALAQRVDEMYSRLLSLADRLHLKKDVGVIDSFREGYPPSKRTVISAADLSGLVAELEAREEADAGEMRKLMDELDQASKREESLERLHATVGAFSKLELDLRSLASLRRLYVELFVADRKDVAEISRSVGDKGALYSEPLDARSALCAVIALRENADYVERAVRAFEVSYLRLPEGYPSVPSEAYRRIAEELEAARKEVEEISKRVKALAEEKGREIEELLEAVELARAQTARMRSSNLKRVAIVEGYVPSGMLENFRRKFGGYLVGVEEQTGDEPGIFRNNRYSANYEEITLQQGPPSKREVDPTTIISFVFPTFFGFMFGDLGHGILLIILGLILRLRGYESLRRWGNLIISFGVGAAIMGVLDGEVFGLELWHLIGVSRLYGIPVPIIPAHDVVTVNSAYVVDLLLVIALLIGVGHILSAYTLGFYQEARARGLKYAAIQRIPVYAFYISALFWGYAFIMSGYSFSAVMGPVMTPLGVTTETISHVTLPIVLAGSIGMIVTKAMESNYMESVIDWLVNVIEIISNSISYLRLAVLLMVHIALLYIIDMFYPAGVAGAAAAVGYTGWILGNMGVAALEGLMVYIQDIRLHAYEWFIRFYEGKGKLFQPLSMRGKRVELRLATIINAASRSTA